MNTAVTPQVIPDVQNSKDTRQIAINKVGIKDIRHPVTVKDRSENPQNTIATFSMYVFLPDHFKGTHMSRFIKIINDNNSEISIISFSALLQEMAQLLEADQGYIEMSFPYFIKKTAPVSGVQSMMDYEITLIGEINKGVINTRVKAVIPVTSLCPCSKSISEYGAHNQRSHVTVDAKIDNDIWIEDIIDLVEAQASCELYSLLKRPDEKFITERAYDNPKFVEDMVRDIAQQLNNNSKIRSYVLETENFESIHNHSAYALISHDKDA